MTTRQTRPRTTRIWIITAAALVVVFYFVHLWTRGKLPIRVATAAIGELRSTVATNAKVEPEPGLNFEAHAPFPGVIQTVRVHEGEKVPADMLLVSMDATEAQARVAAAEAGVKGAQAAWDAALHGGTPQQRLALQGQLQAARIERDQARHDVAALEQLIPSGAASPSEVSAARQRLAADSSALHVLEERQSSGSGPADLAHAHAALQDAQAAYAAALDALHQAVVHAPFAGTVYSLPVSQSEYVQQGDRLLSLADLSHMQVLAYFDEPEVGKLRVGQPVTIAWDARPNETWHGVLARLPSTIITYGTRNVGEALVRLIDADGALLPDTNVRVTVTTASESNVLTVPHDALHFEQGTSYVYRVEGGSLHRVPVVLGTVNLTSVQVLSGIKAGDVVALGTTNGQPLGDGLPVRIVR